MEKEYVHRSCPDVVFIVEVRNNGREKNSQGETWGRIHSQPRWSKHKHMGPWKISALALGKEPRPSHVALGPPCIVTALGVQQVLDK